MDRHLTNGLIMAYRLDLLIMSAHSMICCSEISRSTTHRALKFIARLLGKTTKLSLLTAICLVRISSWRTDASQLFLIAKQREGCQTTGNLERVDTEATLSRGG